MAEVAGLLELEQGVRDAIVIHWREGRPSTRSAVEPGMGLRIRIWNNCRRGEGLDLVYLFLWL